MELFPFAEAGAPLLLSASESGLFLHPVRNERFGHPFLLCSGYKNGFSGCVYNDSLYYAYINKEHSLLLRRLHESTVLFRLDGADTVTYQATQLVAFQGSLLLFFWEKEGNSYRIRLQFPLSDRELQLPEPLGQAYSAPPLLSLQTAGHYLYLFLTAGATDFSYRYSKDTGFEALSSEEDLHSRLRIPWEAEKAQLEQALLQAVHLSEQQQSLLTEKEQELQLTEARLSKLSSESEQTHALLSETTHSLQTTQAQLAKSEQNRQQVVQNLEHTSRLLERAKTQYSELMQVAEQYRQEAMKWYRKFTDRN